MRKRIIRAFLGVYLAICVTYGVVRGVATPAIAEDEPVTDVPPEQTTAEPVIEAKAEIEERIETPTPTPVPMPDVSASGEASYSGRRSRGRGRRDGSFEMDSQTENASLPAVQMQAVPAETVPEEEPQTGETADEKKTSQEDASTPAAIPTLQDYLKNLHCGGCGRNCFLLNPHCMRGARKEAQAESAYYELYSEAAGDGI